MQHLVPPSLVLSLIFDPGLFRKAFQHPGGEHAAVPEGLSAFFVVDGSLMIAGSYRPVLPYRAAYRTLRKKSATPQREIPAVEDRPVPQPRSDFTKVLIPSRWSRSRRGIPFSI